MFVFSKKYKNDRSTDNVIFKYEKKGIVSIQRDKKMKKKKKEYLQEKNNKLSWSGSFRWYFRIKYVLLYLFSRVTMPFVQDLQSFLKYFINVYKTLWKNDWESVNFYNIVSNIIKLYLC